MLVVTKVGLHANVTDIGRCHAQIDGYSQAGAVDWFNYALANAICGNRLDNIAIEVMGGQFAFTVNIECSIAVTGANADIFINDDKILPFTHYQLHCGDELSIGSVNKGLFNYISLSTTLDVPQFRNSVCAVKREQVGGLLNVGDGLQQGDCISMLETKVMMDHVDEINSRNKRPQNNKNEYVEAAQRRSNTPSLSPSILQYLDAQYSSTKQISMVFSYQHKYFIDIQKHLFLSHNYLVSKYIDKMGVRLNGPSLTCSINALTSQPIALGAIQIAGDGKPIIMRNDRQTIGGYPIIGVVDHIGLSILAQTVPGETIRFINTSIENALATRHLLRQQLGRILSKQQQFLVT